MAQENSQFQFVGLNLKSGQDGAKIGSLYPLSRIFTALPINPPTDLIALISDSNTKIIGDIVTGGGGNSIFVIYNGVNWIVWASGNTVVTTTAIWG